MKKICFIMAIIMLLSFAGCSQDKADSSKEKASSISSSGKQPTNADISTVSENDSESSSMNNLQSNSINDNESSNDIVYIDQPPTESYTCFAKNGATIDTFIDWCKECKTNDDFYSEYYDDSNLIDYLRTCDKIVVPTIKNSEYEFYLATTLTNRSETVGYKMVLSSDTNPHLTIVIKPISAIEYLGEKNILEEYMNTIVSSDSYTIEKSFVVDEEHSKEYYKHKSTRKMDGGSITLNVGATFLIPDYIISVNYQVYEENEVWNPKYFDYFDFETVSLK